MTQGQMAAYTAADAASLGRKLLALAETLTPGEQAAFVALLGEMLEGADDAQGFAIYGPLDMLVFKAESYFRRDYNGDGTIGMPR